MAEIEFTLGQLTASLDALREKVDDLRQSSDDRFDRIDARLEAGDKKFEEAATTQAVTTAVHGLASRFLMWVGGTALAALGAAAASAGWWVIHNAQWLLDIFNPPKGH